MSHLIDQHQWVSESSIQENTDQLFAMHVGKWGSGDWLWTWRVDQYRR